MSLPLERINSSIGNAIKHIHDITTERNRHFVDEFILKSLISAQAIVITYIEDIRLHRRIKRRNNKRNRTMNKNYPVLPTNGSEGTKKEKEEEEEEEDMRVNFQELDV
jgi:uridine kinase